MPAPKTQVEVQLVGLDGNVFSIIGRVTRALRRAGHGELAVEFRTAAMQQHSYDDVLGLVMQYVDAT